MSKLNFKDPKVAIPTAVAFAILMVSAVSLWPMSPTVAEEPQVEVTTERSYSKMSKDHSFAGEKPEIVGSANLAEAVNNFIQENRNVAFSEAAITAENKLGDYTIVKGKFGKIQGYLVYTFFGIDNEEQAKYMIVDAGNGKVLYESDPISMEKFSKFIPADVSAGIDLLEAAGIAQKAIENGVVQMGMLKAQDDNTVYKFVVTDSEQELKYIVTIDADDVLDIEISEGMSMKSWGFDGKHYGGHGYGHGEKTWSYKDKHRSEGTQDSGEQA